MEDLYGEAHRLVMCMESDFEKWKNGELIYDFDNDKLIPYTSEIRKLKEEDGRTEYITYDNFNDWSYHDFDTFLKTFTTPNGETVIGFGYYGYVDN